MPANTRYSTLPSRQGCRCAAPVGDPREMTCILCGHQVNGKPLPARGIFKLVDNDQSSYAKPSRKFRPAA